MKIFNQQNNLDSRFLFEKLVNKKILAELIYDNQMKNIIQLFIFSSLHINLIIYTLYSQPTNIVVVIIITRQKSHRTTISVYLPIDVV